MNARLTIDGAGRVVLPKPLRDELELETGDSLELESAGEKITLRPVRVAAPLTKEQGVWVFRTGQPLTAAVTDAVLRELREDRDEQHRDPKKRMKAFLDTSVLVPVFHGDHMHHAASLDVFTRFDKKDVSCGAHSLVEVYSSLTRMPGKLRISSEQGMLFVGSIRERLTIVGLTPDEYFKMLQTNADLGVVGGAIYDAVLASCAVKSGAEKLFTWNLRHYGQFGPDVTRLLRTP